MHLSYIMTTRWSQFHKLMIFEVALRLLAGYFLPSGPYIPVILTWCRNFRMDCFMVLPASLLILCVDTKSKGQRSWWSALQASSRYFTTSGWILGFTYWSLGRHYSPKPRIRRRYVTGIYEANYCAEKCCIGLTIFLKQFVLLMLVGNLALV